MNHDKEIERQMIEDMERVDREDFLSDDLSHLYPDDPNLIGFIYINRI